MVNLLMGKHEKILTGLAILVFATILLFIVSSAIDLSTGIKDKILIRKIEREYKRKEDSIIKEFNLIQDSTKNLINTRDSIIASLVTKIRIEKRKRDISISVSNKKYNEEIIYVSNTVYDSTIAISKRLNNY